MRKKALFWNIILVLLLFILGAELLLPRLARQKFREILVRESDSIEELAISASAFPAFKILLGRLDYVEIKAAEVVVDGLSLKSLLLKYQDVRLRDQSFSGDNTILQILLEEEGLNRYIKARYPELKDFTIGLLPGQVVLGGAVTFLEATIRLQLAGRLFITEQAEIEFVPENLQVEDVKIPLNLIQKYVNKLGFSFDLKELEIPLTIDQIEVSAGELRIIGEKSQ